MPTIASDSLDESTHPRNIANINSETIKSTMNVNNCKRQPVRFLLALKKTNSEMMNDTTIAIIIHKYSLTGSISQLS
jgi:hypothetical protein